VSNGIVFKPTTHSFKVWADANFGGLWDKDSAPDSPVTAKSRAGYLITYANCPVMWASQLQTEYALSATEAEYIALSTALQNVLPLIRLVKEIKAKTTIPTHDTPTAYCTAFEDNAGALELAKVPKMRPSIITLDSMLLIEPLLCNRLSHRINKQIYSQRTYRRNCL
jgi:hypothetical protein